MINVVYNVATCSLRQEFLFLSVILFVRESVFVCRHTSACVGADM